MFFSPLSFSADGGKKKEKKKENTLSSFFFFSLAHAKKGVLSLSLKRVLCDSLFTLATLNEEKKRVLGGEFPVALDLAVVDLFECVQ